jgi:hypothetical protein
VDNIINNPIFKNPGQFYIYEGKGLLYISEDQLKNKKTQYILKLFNKELIPLLSEVSLEYELSSR